MKLFGEEKLWARPSADSQNKLTALSSVKSDRWWWFFVCSSLIRQTFSWDDLLEGKEKCVSPKNSRITYYLAKSCAEKRLRNGKTNACQIKASMSLKDSEASKLSSCSGCCISRRSSRRFTRMSRAREKKKQRFACPQKSGYPRHKIARDSRHVQ